MRISFVILSCYHLSVKRIQGLRISSCSRVFLLTVSKSLKLADQCSDLKEILYVFRVKETRNWDVWVCSRIWCLWTDQNLYTSLSHVSVMDNVGHFSLMLTFCVKTRNGSGPLLSRWHLTPRWCKQSEPSLTWRYQLIEPSSSNQTSFVAGVQEQCCLVD